MAPNVQTKILRKARTSEEYTVYLAAHEWDLIDPIVIENRDDVKSEATWLGRLPFMGGASIPSPAAADRACALR